MTQENHFGDKRSETSHIKRQDDIWIRIPGGFEFAASGKYVILFLIVIILAAYGIWHDYKTETIHVELLRAQETMICVLTLNELERREYRTDGRYCGRTYGKQPYYRGN